MKRIFTAIMLFSFSASVYPEVIDFSQLSNDNASFYSWYDGYDSGYMVDEGSPLEIFVGNIYINRVIINSETNVLDDQIVSFCGALHDEWVGSHAYDGIQALNTQNTIDTQVGILCDLFHLGSLASDWAGGATVNGTDYVTQAYYVAFQLALWEITLNDDLSLTSNTGDLYYQSGLKRYGDSIALGDYMLGQVQAAYNNGDSFTSEVFRLQGYVSAGVANQDLVVVSNIPEPLTLSLFGISGLFLWIFRKLMTAR